MHRVQGIALLAVLVSGPACSTPLTGSGLEAGAAISVLPNIGLTVAAARPWGQMMSRDWAWEVQYTRQWFDDEDLLDDGNPSAAPVDQLQVGAKTEGSLSGPRVWTGRAGLVWLHAGPIPNMVDQAGHHGGVYFSLGFQTRLGEDVTVGPELALLFVDREGHGTHIEPLPQFLYRLTWTF